MPTRADLHDDLVRWAERLELAVDVLRRRAQVDLVSTQMIDTVENVAAELRLKAAHVSTWPAPGGSESGE